MRCSASIAFALLLFPGFALAQPDDPDAPLSAPVTMRPPPDEAYMIEEIPRQPPEPCEHACAIEADDDGYDDLEAGWLQIHAFGGWASLDRYGLGTMPSEDEPDPLRNRAIALDGSAPTLGGGVRFGYQSDEGVRIGAGFGGYAIEGLRLEGGRLPGGVVARANDVVAVRAELALGKAFDAGPIWPYVDAVVSVNVVTAEVGLETPQHGFVGETTYGVVSATVAPRLGLFVPLSDDVFLDVAGQYGLFGVERGSLLVGLGVWDD